MDQNKTDVNEKLITGRKFRRLIDKESNIWERTSGWVVTDRPFHMAVPITINKTQKEK